MADAAKPKIGTIGWMDLTVPNAVEVRDFYKAVIGWEQQDVPMGDYNDFAMTPPGRESAVTGVCHARGVNQGQPPCWMIYIIVANLDESLSAVRRHGGEVRSEIRDCGGYGRFCVIRDPSGAYAALFESPS